MVTVGFNPSTLKVIMCGTPKKVITNCCTPYIYSGGSGDALSAYTLGKKKLYQAFNALGLSFFAQYLDFDVDENVYAAGARFGGVSPVSVVKLNKELDTEVWRYDTGGDAWDIFLDQGNGVVYVVGDEVGSKNIWKLNASTGAFIASYFVDLTDRFEPPGPTEYFAQITSIAVDFEGSMYVGFADRIQFGIRPYWPTIVELNSTGVEQNRLALGLNPGFDDYVGVRRLRYMPGGILYAVSGQAQTGPGVFWNFFKITNMALTWRKDSVQNIVHDVSVDRDGDIYVAGGDSGTNDISKWNAAGVLQWEVDLGSGPQSAYVIEAALFTGGGGSWGMKVRDKSDGSEIWTHSTSTRKVWATPDISAHIVNCDVTCIADGCGGGEQRVSAAFTIFDQDNNDLEGATVFVDFGGPVGGSGEGVTDGSGIATVLSDCSGVGGEATATVTDIRIGGKSIWDKTFDECDSDFCELNP